MHQVCNVAFINNSNNNCIISCFIADEEFDELCFEFGLELDEIVSHQSSDMSLCPQITINLCYELISVVFLLRPQMVAFVE